MVESVPVDQPKRKPGRPPKVPAADKPFVAAPEANAEKPVVAAKAAEISAKPAVAKPAVAKPAVAKPAVAKPAVAKPAVVKPPVAKAPAVKAAAPATPPSPAAVEKPAPVVAEPVVPAPAAQIAEVIEAVSSPAVLSDVTAVAAEAAPLEEVQKMATIEHPSVEKAQAIFGDVSERVKAAFEKSTKVSEELVELAKGGETLGQEAAEYGKKSFESAMAMFKSFTQVRTPTEFFQVQSDYAKASLESAVAEASKVSESLLRLAGDVVQPLSNRYAVAAEKMKSVTL